MTNTDQTEDPMRAFVSELFKPEPDETDEPDDNSKPSGNFVPREGANLEPAADPDKAMRAFVSELFDNNA